MTTIAIQIIQLALSLLQDQNGAAMASIFVQIVAKALQAYQDHTGQPMDLTLIKAEAPI